MFGNFSGFVEAENVKRDLLACTGEIVDRLQENFVAVFKRADIVNRRLDRGRSKEFDGFDKGVSTGSVGKVVLDVIFVQKF